LLDSLNLHEIPIPAGELDIPQNIFQADTAPWFQGNFLFEFFLYWRLSGQKPGTWLYARQATDGKERKNTGQVSHFRLQSMTSNIRKEHRNCL
jgi:hypothetical protein